MTRLNRTTLTLLVALILGFSWDMLFYGKPLGISVLLFVLLVLAALFGLSRWWNAYPAWRNLWLLAPLLFFAAMVAVRANAFVTFLNIVACLVLLGLVAHFYAAGWIGRLGLAGYPLVLLQVIGNTFIRPAPLVATQVNMKSVQTRGWRNILPVLRGLLLALPVLFVFTCLLASADLVFAHYLEDALQLKFLSDLMEWLWRGVIILVIAWILAGGLFYAFSRSLKTDDSNVLEKILNHLLNAIPLGFIETAILLGLVDLLFLVFVGIQFAYLFGGQENISVAGYTYAEYARRGFFELVAVSVLSLGLILTMHRLARAETGWQKVTLKGLSSVLVASVLVFLASAFQRMSLYESAYGYTELRLYSHIFMIWLAAAFVWFVGTLWSRSQHFALGLFAASLGFVLTLNLINPDAFIARQNLARYQASGKLDADYLTILSDDVVPELVAAVNQVSGQEQQILQEHLHIRREHLAATLTAQSWPSFHWTEWRAYTLLTGME